MYMMQNINYLMRNKIFKKRMQISTFFSSKYNKNRYTEEDLVHMVFGHSASTSHFAK